MIKLVIFDFDGVLIDSKELIKYAFEESYKRVLKNNDVPPVTRFFEYMGESLKKILEKLDLPSEIADCFREISERNIDKIKLYPGTKEVLLTLKSLNINIVLVTGKDYYRTEKILHHFDCYNFFDFIVTPDILWNSKPDPEGILFLLSQYGFHQDEVMMVGDSYFDILAANRAGVHSIGIIWDANENSKVQDAKHIISNWDQFLKLIYSTEIYK
jgi:pyrophosphatase PpaX